MSGLEILGYVASLLVAASLMMKSILRLRVVNLVGAICFTIYGLFIHAYPVALVNFAIVLINIYRLFEIASAREYFKLVEVARNSEYLREFLRYHADEIQRFNPGVVPHPADADVALFVLRDMVPAGLFLGRQQAPDTLLIDLDYVAPGFRDFKIGHFVFRNHHEAFTRRGIRRVVTAPGSREHEPYLIRMGFQADKAADGTRTYSLDIPAEATSSSGR